MSGGGNRLTIPPELDSELTTPPPVAFVETLLIQIEVLQARVTALEVAVKELGCDRKAPQNSSLPPRSWRPHARPAPLRKLSGKKPGGQRGHSTPERTLIPTEQCRDAVLLKPSARRRWWGCSWALFGNRGDA